MDVTKDESVATAVKTVQQLLDKYDVALWGVVNNAYVIFLYLEVSSPLFFIYIYFIYIVELRMVSSWTSQLLLKRNTHLT